MSRLRVGKNLFQSFRDDARGVVALIFALAIIPLALAVGLAIDSARGYYTATKLAAVLDASALAATKFLREREATDEEIDALVRLHVDTHMQSDAYRGVSILSLSVTVDRTASIVTIDGTATVDNHIGTIVGINSFQVRKTVQATFAMRDIEVGLMLDVSGSMADRDKIGQLRAAVTSFVDVVLPEGGSVARARIGLAPFASSVNAGAYSPLVTAGSPENTCVTERNGTPGFTDASPDSGPPIRAEASSCPSAEIAALSGDRNALLRNVATLTAAGRTAGHLGIAWAWYLVSPNWAGIWAPSDPPKPYGDPKVVKAVVLMTDGMFNTAYEPSNGSSSEQAERLCTSIKASGVFVYAIGFDAPPEILPLLRQCASSPTAYFEATDADQLSAAFRNIGHHLTALRLSR